MKKFSIIPGLMLLMLAFLISMPAAGQAGFGFHDMFKIKKEYNPRISPDGRYVIFETYEADTSQNRWISHLWRTTVSTNETVQMTRGEHSDSHPRWSPDGGSIFFLSSRDDHKNIFVISNEGGEVHSLFTHPANITDFQFSDDGSELFFLAEDSLTREEIANEKSRNDAYVVDETEKPVRLWVYSMLTGTRKQLTHGKLSIREFRLAPDQTAIAFIAAPSPREDDYLNREIYLLHLDGLTEKQLTHNRTAESTLQWSPDGKYISFLSDASSQLETYYQTSIFLLDVNTGTVIDQLPDFKYQVMDYFWTAKGRYIYFIANMGVNTQFFKLNRRAGGLEQATTGEHDIRSAHYNAQGNRLVYLESTPEHPYEVCYAEPEKLPGSRITNLNSWLDVYAKPEYRTVHWKSTDGHQAEGILILPTTDLNKPHPLVIQLHGGPESSYRNEFSSSWGNYAQIWADHGYAVFQPNYRGSTGYGDDVMRSIIGHYFEKDIDDIISGVDYLIREGIADPQKMAVMGWSAGGHLTNWLVTHFQRFKVASSGAGGANWFSFYAQTDVQYIREIWHMGPPYDRADYYMEKSPISYVKNAKTPTLILCGKEDSRVPFPQSLEMYRGLKRNGCPVKFVAFPREGHGLRELKHQLYKMRVEFQWIEKHLFNHDWKISDLN
ncbi:MAG: S9 family peptidase [Calditrichia bacterium]